MNNIPIFDSLTHPTLTGDWIMPRYPNKSILENMLDEMSLNNIFKAFAVGMKGIGGYDEQKYVNFILSKTDKFIPIAFFDVTQIASEQDIIVRIEELKKMNYKGIKLHPRIGGFDLRNKYLPLIVKIANKEGLSVLLCTYFYSNAEKSHINSADNLIRLLEHISEERIVLLHGGGVNLLTYMEIARAFTNVLLDLSLTFCKYEGSSIDLDLKFMFESFDRRICIGSDYPEFGFFNLRERFEYFSENINDEKLENIAWRNLSNYIKF